MPQLSVTIGVEGMGAIRVDAGMGRMMAGTIRTSRRLATVGQVTSALSLVVFAAVTVVAASAPATARTASPASQFSASLAPGERARFEAWYKAQVFHDAAMDAYWSDVEQKRRQRRAKRRKGLEFADRDYVAELPPVYDGPNISRALLARWYRFRDPEAGTGKPRAREELPGLDVYLASARQIYNFAPERIREVEFKRRYAREALARGLTKDQVVRVYALETGGRGTADMQAGINPVTGKGVPISSALGYAQLLAANSVNVLAKHGRGMVERLAGMVRGERDARQRARLKHKLDVLRRMVHTARSVPYNWSKHMAFARTPRGRGLHVMNIDGLIGPWMQVVKLADLKALAEQHGRTALNGAEIELMNLAGPATGLEMMTRTGLSKPTANFFSRRGYYRNTIVRGKDARGLLVALDERMQHGLKNDGSREFLAVFDQLLGKPVRQQAEEVRPFGFATRAFQPSD